MQERVTMREVAKAAGVSLATVSRVLSGYPHVRADVKRRVEIVLERLRYRPDPALRAIAACRWQGRRARSGEVIAWLDFEGGGRSRPSRGVQEAAGREGYRVENIAAHLYASAGKLGDVLLSRGIHGIVLPNVEPTPDLVGMQWERFCVVAFGVSYASNPVDTVRFNPFETVELAVRKLVAAGARRLGFVLLHGQQGLTAINRKMMASFLFATAAEKNVAGIEPLAMAFGPDNEERAVRWFSRERPDGLIGLHAGVRVWFEVVGVRFPRDAAFLCLRKPAGDEVTAGFLNLQEECAQIALEQVILRLRQNRRGIPANPMDYVLAPQWVPGTTCPEP